MQSQCGRVGTSRREADKILPIDGSPEWEIIHSSFHHLYRHWTDAGGSRKIDGIIWALEGVGSAHRKGMGACDGPQDNPVAGTVGGDRHRAGSGEQLAASHVQEANTNVIIQGNDSSGGGLVDRESVEGCRTGDRTTRTAHELNDARSGNKGTAIEPIPVEWMREWTGAERGAGTDRQITQHSQRASGSFGAAARTAQVVVGNRQERLRAGRIIVDRVRSGSWGIENAGGDRKTPGDTEDGAGAQLQLRAVERHIE